jgi:hypothetical protein
VAVSVSLTWDGKARTQEFTARKDRSRVHYLFYYSWRMEVPAVTLHLTLPNQPGPILIDGNPNPALASPNVISAIMGYHQLEMAANTYYNGATQIVDAVSGASTSFEGKLSSTALAALGDAVKGGFAAGCDPAKYDACFGHVYTAANPGAYIYYITLPGYGDINYTRYVFNVTGDVTAGMTVTIAADKDKVTASGSCTATMTVDGRRNYNFKGDWTATLTWNGTGFNSDVVHDCLRDKA